MPVRYFQTILFSLFLQLSITIATAQEFSEDQQKPEGIFSGETKRGLRHGKGTYQWADGTTYTGQWRNNEMFGYGTMTWPNGDVYKGNWMNNLMDGYGTFQWKDGSYFSGYYYKGKKSGKGKLNLSDGSIHEGYFNNDMANGEGTHTYPDGSEYIGDWKDNKRHGKGVYIQFNGEILQGKWKYDNYVPCDCKIESLPPEEAYALSQAVFVGKVVDIKIEEEFDKIKFEVERYWKGELFQQEYIYITSSLTSCDFVFIEGLTYLVYAQNGVNNTYSASKCNRNMLIHNAYNDLIRLKEYVSCAQTEDTNDGKQIKFLNLNTDETIPVCGCDTVTYQSPQDAKDQKVGSWIKGDCKDLYGIEK